MDCDRFVELVTAFLDDALDSDTEQQVVEHLAECDGCGIYLDQMREVVRDLGQLPPDRLAEGTRAALLAVFRRETG
jgi:predicted anti-sigma-YlaC factor YlaD